MALGAGLSASFGIGTETTPLTPVAVTRFAEFDSESMATKKHVVQGVGLRGGGLVRRATRRIYVSREAQGGVNFDAMTNGLQRSDLIIIAGRPSMGKCLAFDSQLVLADGSVSTIKAIYQKYQEHQTKPSLLTLGEDWRFEQTQPSAFIDDGIKPVFRVTTALGRQIETTLTHPFLTITGWQKLSKLCVGDKIALPRQIAVFGQEVRPSCEIKLLAYFLGDGWGKN